MKTKIILILNNIRSAENVGSIFRTADAAGVEKILLVGYTPAPVDRFERPNSKIAKAALGAEKSVLWGKYQTLKEAIESVKEDKYCVVAVEQDEQSIDYKDIKQKVEGRSIALVLGNEVLGLSKEDLSLCDLVAEIPMRGEKESLNVAIAAGVVLFSLQ